MWWATSAATPTDECGRDQSHCMWLDLHLAGVGFLTHHKAHLAEASAAPMCSPCCPAPLVWPPQHLFEPTARQPACEHVLGRSPLPLWCGEGHAPQPGHQAAPVLPNQSSLGGVHSGGLFTLRPKAHPQSSPLLGPDLWTWHSGAQLLTPRSMPVTQRSASQPHCPHSPAS